MDTLPKQPQIGLRFDSKSCRYLDALADLLFYLRRCNAVCRKVRSEVVLQMLCHSLDETLNGTFSGAAI